MFPSLSKVMMNRPRPNEIEATGQDMTTFSETRCLLMHVEHGSKKKLQRDTLFFRAITLMERDEADEDMEHWKMVTRDAT